MIVAIRPKKKNENLLNNKGNMKKEIEAQVDHLSKSKYFIIPHATFYVRKKGHLRKLRYRKVK